MNRSSQNDRERLRLLREQVKARINYRSFYLRYCRDEHARGQGTQRARLQTLCPIPAHAHSGKGHPSLSVDLKRGLFHCFSRNDGGDAIRFYELMHNVSFTRALRDMASELGLSEDQVCADHRQLPLAFRAAPDEDCDALLQDADAIDINGNSTTHGFAPLDAERLGLMCEKFLETCRAEDQLEAVNYLARRGIDVEAMNRLGVAYFPRRAYHRVMRRMMNEFALVELQQSGLFNANRHLTFYRHRLLFPFYVENRAVYLQARTIASGIEPRWHNLRGAVPALYNADALAALPSNSIVHLVEGFTDTLTLAAHNFAAVGIVGAGGLKEEWLSGLARFQVVAALDPDVAGERAVVRYQEMFARRRMQLACVRLASDINDFFRRRPSAPLEFQLLTEAALAEVEEVVDSHCGVRV